VLWSPKEGVFRPYRGPGVIRTLQQKSSGGGSMRFFLEDSADILRSFEVVRARFTGDGSWLAPLASAAEEEGEALVVRIGPSWGSGRAARKVRVTLGPPHDRGQAIVVPLSWRSIEHPGLFPVLDGDIELSALDQDRCRVALAASYVPPLGELGRQLDRALLHRVARSTARSFLAQVVAGLEDHGADRPILDGADGSQERDFRP